MARSARSLDFPTAAGLLVAIVLLGLAIRLPLVHEAGATGDMDLFAAWLRAALSAAPGDLYARVPDFNYPPASAAMLLATAAIVRHFGGTFNDIQTVREAVKIPTIIADLVCTLFAFDIARRLAGKVAGLAAAAATAFNPASIYISAFWGQFDSIPIALALAAVHQVLFGSAIVAWPLLALAALVKPQVILLVPILAIAALGPKGAPAAKRRLYAHLTGAAFAVLLVEIFAVTFFPERSILGATAALFHQVRSGSSYFSYTSLNAFNVWALFGDFFQDDRRKFLDVKLKLWGELAFVALAVAIYARYAALRTRKSLLEACALVMLALFCFLTEMHERYIYFALPFFAILIFERRYALGWAMLAITSIFNLEYAYTQLVMLQANVTAVNINEFAPWLVHVCSLANVGLFLWLFLAYVGVRFAPAPGFGSTEPG